MKIFKPAGTVLLACLLVGCATNQNIYVLESHVRAKPAKCQYTKFNVGQRCQVIQGSDNIKLLMLQMSRR